MRIRYADPPYIGQAKKHYSHDPKCAEVDHERLIADMALFDGWALSLSVPSLRVILPMCPTDVRIMAWVKPFCAFKKNVNPAYAWEPVIVKPCRKRTKEQPTERDWIAENITLKKGLSGVKPMKFSFWLFEVLGAEPDDEFDDMFPGSGAVGDAWKAWSAIKRHNPNSNHLVTTQ